MLPLVFFWLPETRTQNKDAQPVPRSKAAPDMMPMGRRRQNDKGAGGQLAYQPLEHEHKHDAEGGEVPPRLPSEGYGEGGSVSPVNGNSVKIHRRAGSGLGSGSNSPIAGVVELAPVKSRRKRNNIYELLDDGDDGADDYDRGVVDTVTNGKVASGSSASVVYGGTPAGNVGGDSGGGGSGGIGGDEEEEEEEEGGDPGRLGKRDLLSSPNVKMILLIVVIVQMASIGFEEIYPLFALSTTDVGGLGWGTEQIGKVLGLVGIILAVLQLGVFPPVIKYVGIVSWQRAGCLLGVPVFLAIPNVKSFSWNESSLFAVNVVGNVLAFCSIGSAMLPLTVASTTIVPQHQRGKLSGLFMTFESLGRFTGPASFSEVFAWSISPSSPLWVDHRFAFFLPAAIMAAVVALGWHTFTAETLENSPPSLAAAETRGGRGGGSAAIAGDGDAASGTAQASAREAFIGAKNSSAVVTARQGRVSPAAEVLPQSPREQQQQGTGALGAVV
eukprot:g10328.t2